MGKLYGSLDRIITGHGKKITNQVPNFSSFAGIRNQVFCLRLHSLNRYGNAVFIFIFV